MSDFYKQAPLVPALVERDVGCGILRVGENYESLPATTYGEYDLESRVIADILATDSTGPRDAQIFSQTQSLATRLTAGFPNKTFLPIVHGDTEATAFVAQGWLLGQGERVAHNEAGLRAMSPSFENYCDIEQFVHDQWHGEWNLNRAEPSPGQNYSFIASSASMFHFPPTTVNRRHLLNEGYPETAGKTRTMATVGNTIVDAIQLKRDESPDRSIFDIYPILEVRDNWIRFEVHKPLTLNSERLRAIVDAIERLVAAGYNVCFVQFPETKAELDRRGRQTDLQEMDRNNDNFLLTGLWPDHYHVYEFLESGQCFLQLFDGGSPQEELNHIDAAIPLTVRYNTDRPETVMEAQTNLLVPPISGEYMYEFIEYLASNAKITERMRCGEKLYNSDAATEIASIVEDVSGPFFHDAVDRLDL